MPQSTSQSSSEHLRFVMVSLRSEDLQRVVDADAIYYRRVAVKAAQEELERRAMIIEEDHSVVRVSLDRELEKYRYSYGKVNFDSHQSSEQGLACEQMPRSDYWRGILIFVALQMIPGVLMRWIPGPATLAVTALILSPFIYRLESSPKPNLERWIGGTILVSLGLLALSYFGIGEG